VINIGFLSYATGATFFFILALILLTGRRERQQKIWLAAACGVVAVWAGSAAYEALEGNTPLFSQVLELTRDLVLLVFLLRLLSTNQDLMKEYGNRLRLVVGVACVFMAVMLFLVFNRYLFRIEIPGSGSMDSLILGHLLLAVLGLVLIEQLFRNTRPDALRSKKYLYLGIGTIFAYDFYLYADALMFQRVDLALWDARGFVNAIAVPVIGIAIARDPQWSLDVFISRRIVFHTTALLGAGIYLLAMGVGGFYVREYGGTWGVVAQTIFFFGATLVLLILMFSGPLRARLRVLINKHFFHYKYDYREEWLRFIRTLSSAEADLQLHIRAIRAIAQIIDSPGGILWMRRDNGKFELVGRWNMLESAATEVPADSSLPRFLEQQEWVVNLDDYQHESNRYKSIHNIAVPDWLCQIPRAWLLVPLILEQHLLGFVVLARSAAQQRHFNWEDCDLLKTAGRQAASHLAQCEASMALAQARQFEAFNRLSAYVVHDIKNLITQLSLVVSNAARHKSNPLFMEDAIQTVENSVAKMNRLLAHLRGSSRGDQATTVNLKTLLIEVVQGHAAHKLAPVLESELNGETIMVNRDRLAAVLGHVIQNAQDATPDKGRITVKAGRVNGYITIEIQDTGCGMDEAFMRERLFRPFDTTKGSSGMGIGAYEAKEFVHSLGGDVEVKSELGKGTCFRIRLPYNDIHQMDLKYKHGTH
jgi:putative PEP-CTERM system histidine kinase